MGAHLAASKPCWTASFSAASAPLALARTISRPITLVMASCMPAQQALPGQLSLAEGASHPLGEQIAQAPAGGCQRCMHLVSDGTPSRAAPGTQAQRRLPGGSSKHGRGAGLMAAAVGQRPRAGSQQPAAQGLQWAHQAAALLDAAAAGFISAGGAGGDGHISAGVLGGAVSHGLRRKAGRHMSGRSLVTSDDPSNISLAVVP
jgi:hypothetical protein